METLTKNYLLQFSAVTVPGLDKNVLSVGDCYGRIYLFNKPTSDSIAAAFKWDGNSPIHMELDGDNQKYMTKLLNEAYRVLRTNESHDDNEFAKTLSFPSLDYCVENNLPTHYNMLYSEVEENLAELFK